MAHRILYERSQAAFSRVYHLGRRDTNLLSRLLGQDNRILTLLEVLQAVQPGGESSLGIQDIRVEDIIGSESKGDDFSRDFYPRKPWMAGRWTTIHHLMSQGTLDQAISVFELGGRYFVRDGHHRVSVAKAIGRVFITAEVRSIALPYGIEADTDRNMLAVLAGKDHFHSKTGMFHFVRDQEFRVQRRDTWSWLEREICDFNLQYFIRRFGRQPESMEEQITGWYKNLYRNAMDYIHHNSLAYLFPGYDETDVFVEMIRFWNGFDQPDDLWLGDMYRQFVARHSIKNPLAALIHRGRRFFRQLAQSPEDEFRLFLRVSQIPDLYPEAPLLPHEPGVYRLCYQQLIGRTAQVLQQHLGRAPYIHELTELWYHRYYKPMALFCLTRESPKEQSGLFLRMSRRWFVPVITGTRDIQEILSDQ